MYKYIHNTYTYYTHYDSVLYACTCICTWAHQFLCVGIIYLPDEVLTLDNVSFTGWLFLLLSCVHGSYI